MPRTSDGMSEAARAAHLYSWVSIMIDGLSTTNGSLRTAMGYSLVVVLAWGLVLAVAATSSTNPNSMSRGR